MAKAQEKMRSVASYPLRLPRSLKAAAERLAREEGTSLNQFVVMAVAEKVSALETAAFFEKRRARADMGAFMRILNREGGVPPRPGDEIPTALGTEGRDGKPGMAGRFPFGDREAIEEWAERYWDEETDKNNELERQIPRIVKKTKSRGHLTREEFLHLVKWKSPRRLDLAERNSAATIRSVTAKALAEPDRERALRILDELPGVALPTATAILHWFRDDTPIIDVRVCKALGLPEKQAESRRDSYRFYRELADRLIAEAQRVGVDLRTLDRALWAWDKAGSGKRRHGPCR